MQTIGELLQRLYRVQAILPHVGRFLGPSGILGEVLGCKLGKEEGFVEIYLHVAFAGGMGGPWRYLKQWQRLFYGERFSAIDLTDHTPDYVKLAEAMGLRYGEGQAPKGLVLASLRASRAT